MKPPKPPIRLICGGEDVTGRPWRVKQMQERYLLSFLVPPVLVAIVATIWFFS